VRAKSTIATGGTANPIFSTMELAGSIIVALLAVFVPILVLVLVGIFLIWIVRKILRRLFKRANSQP
jgi:flagellar biogenesis protein FliO